jgi:hypothetical protein
MSASSGSSLGAGVGIPVGKASAHHASAADSNSAAASDGGVLARLIGGVSVGRGCQRAAAPEPRRSAG